MVLKLGVLCLSLVLVQLVRGQPGPGVNMHGGQNVNSNIVNKHNNVPVARHGNDADVSIDGNQHNIVAQPVDNNDPPQAADGHRTGLSRKPAPPGIKKGLRKHSDSIADSVECSNDVEMYCGSTLTSRDNLAVLTCLNNRQDDDLTEECHHYLWTYKLNITKNPKFDSIARQTCKSALQTHTDCDNAEPGSGKLVSCLLEYKDTIKAHSCVNFLNKIAGIVFSDYRLICNFMEDCSKDIMNHHCGRVDSTVRGDADMPHSQGQVVECLEEKMVDRVDGVDLQPKCKQQIKRLGELSADDYNLDRNLYLNCRDDRERLCPDVLHGDGRVYKCLFNHKFDEGMSTTCRDALTVRQKLVAKDYKASYQLQTQCKSEISNNFCFVSHNSNDHSDLVGSSGILLCLENARSNPGNGGKISAVCNNALDDFRAMLMSDYNLSPEITHNCAVEIRANCSGTVEKEGATIHCLMSHLREDSDEGSSCEKALLDLLKETDVAGKYKMDVALATDCNGVIQSVCSKYADGDPMVLSCLMENLYSAQMEVACQDRLLELQYFISRDFNSDPSFHKACKAESKVLCNHDFAAGAGNGQSENIDADAMPLSLVISCLYRHIQLPGEDRSDIDGSILSAGCTREVHRMLKQRALDFNLNPELEHTCRTALGQYCSNEMPEPGMELVCLQDNLENITETNLDCANMITDLTVMESKDSDLENVLISACEPMLQQHCKDFLDSGDEGEIMECLIRNKDEMDSPLCAAGVNHFQLIEMKDYHFTPKFMKACKDDVRLHCSDKKTKADVVKCLSEDVRNAVLQKRQSRISKKCQGQLTVENLQLHEKIDFLPGLHKACQADYRTLCFNVQPGKAMVIECLRNNKDKVSHECRKELFEVEEEESLDPKIDFALMRTCKSDIKEWCFTHLEDGRPHEILDCLIHNKKKLQSQCRNLIKSREADILSDVDLDPDLKESCSKDIKDFCGKESQQAKLDHERGEDPHGVIYACLKKVHTSGEHNNKLSPSCNKHITFVVREEEQDYRLDPRLMLACVNEIRKHCDTEHEDIVECLKRNFYDEKLSASPTCVVEVARLLLEGRSDIMADPVLHEACAIDLEEHCDQIPEGDGRKIQCLTRILAKHKTQLSQGCREELQVRQSMWAHAAKKNIDGFSELSMMVLASEQSSYLLSMLTLLAVGILVLGTMCGRCTKRVARDRKTR
ncbi:Golgi apparatus protein 1 [Ciona intestinalis]